jgi:tetratricopeptide (TPR) repeat protein
MHGRIWVSGLALLAVVALATTGCEREPAPQDQATGSVTGQDMQAARAGWPAGASEHLDSANAAFSAKNHQEALRHYQALLDLRDAPRSLQTTAYFGLYMTYSALGDTAQANAATAKLQELEPDASLMHGNPMLGDSASAPAAPDDSIHRGMRQ